MLILAFWLLVIAALGDWERADGKPQETNINGIGYAMR